MRAAVVGAGIVGAATARALARRGARVTVFEQHSPGSGTSGTSFAWVNSHNKLPEAYHRLNLEGCAEHRRVAAQLPGSAAWYFPTGNLEWAGDEDGAQRLVERFDRLSGLGYPCRWLDVAEARRLEPDVLIPEDALRIALFPDEAHVFPVPLLAALLGDAVDHGAQVRAPVRVASIETAAAGAEVVLADGAHEQFDVVVSCAGRWTRELLGSVPLVDPSEAGGAAVGFLGFTDSIPARVSRVLTTPRLNVRPDGGGRLVVQGLDLDGAADPAQPPGCESSIATQLLDRLRDVLVPAHLVAMASLRVGQRVLPADGFTVAGPVDDGRHCYVLATHSGITMGPVLGELAAAEVIDGERSPLLADFRPDRFDGASIPSVKAARRPGEQ